MPFLHFEAWTYCFMIFTLILLKFCHMELCHEFMEDKDGKITNYFIKKRRSL
jgi:hypothetical protein